MIRHLHIENYALIEHLDMDFHTGFSVITGETGAGKSIILGAIVILATIGQFVSLAQARRYGSVPFFFWIFPSILFLIGVYCVVKPVDSASLPLFIIGWALMVYGVVECTNAFKIYRLKKAWQKMNEQAQKPQLDNIQDAEEVKESQDAETRKSSSDDAQA